MVLGRTNPLATQISGQKKRRNADSGCRLSKQCPQLANVLSLHEAEARKILFLPQSLLNLAEIADGTSFVASQRDQLRLPVLSIRSDGNRRGHPPQRNTTKEGHDNTIPQSSDSESSSSSNQEEIIALFRRIQSSISKGGSESTKKRRSKNSKEKQPDESVLEVLRQSRKQLKDNASGKEDRKLPHRRGAPKKERSIQDSSPKVDFKLTRPPSSFVKRSPIPPPSIPEVQVVEVIEERSPAAIGGKELKLERVEEMKLPELKELAKSRGIKGYSRLKKSELMDLLKGLSRS
ncbi:hypothetical protein HHK36_023512 [Tetracentron sinense]|uniref:Rho termination factor-like N-terminal domain-containing protein n=1 Tax=Tetracentron sinense TaxID=13715 RepID=A0A834YNW1_TETSI|nr:hypothetical protein HHK36_023512 [Tetracentron sinense]